MELSNLEEEVQNARALVRERLSQQSTNNDTLAKEQAESIINAREKLLTVDRVLRKRQAERDSRREGLEARTRQS